MHTGKGEPGQTYSYKLSGPIDLAELKARSKELNVTINELFVGAVVTAYSKLELPEERTPSAFRAWLAASTALESKPMDAGEFVPENEVISMQPVFDRCTDLKQASLAVQRELVPIRGRKDLF